MTHLEEEERGVGPRYNGSVGPSTMGDGDADGAWVGNDDGTGAVVVVGADGMTVGGGGDGTGLGVGTNGC